MTKVELVCKVCEKRFLREWGEVNRSRRPREGPFCSRGCSNTFHFKNKKLSKELKEKLMGKTPWNKGIPWSQKMKERMSKSASNGTHSMEKNGNWKGGRSITSMGYVEIRVNGKPRLEHVHLMEKKIGRHLRKGEVVHHLNTDRTDNRLENLQLLTISEHMSIHNPKGTRFGKNIKGK